jgi:hypothetical protein
MFRISAPKTLQLTAIFAVFAVTIFISPSISSELTTKAYLGRKTSIIGDNIATAGQIAQYVADGETGEMKLTGATLAPVATSGDYSDLTNTPVIPEFMEGLTVDDILIGTDTANKLVSAETLNKSIFLVGTASGGSPNYTATVPGYTRESGAVFRLLINGTNTQDSVNLNVNGTGATNLTFRWASNYVGAGRLQTGTFIDVRYYSGRYVIVGEPTKFPGKSDNIRAGEVSAGLGYYASHIKEAIMSYAGDLLLTTGTGGAYIVSNATNYTLDTANFNNGTKIVVKIHANNEAAATLNLNNLGAKPIFYQGAAIVAGMLQANGTYILVYDGTNWNVVQSPGSGGSIPLAPEECIDVAARCMLGYGDTDLTTPGIQGPGYVWEIVER